MEKIESMIIAFMKKDRLSERNISCSIDSDKHAQIEKKTSDFVDYKYGVKSVEFTKRNSHISVKLQSK